MDLARKLALAAALATTLVACGSKDQGESSNSPFMPHDIPEIDPMVRFPIHKPEKKLTGPAQNKAIVFGGNCEGRKERSNMFFEPFKSLTTSLAKHGWNPDVFYGSKSIEPAASYEDLVKAAGGSSSVDEGSLENLFAAMDSALALPRGSQLLLVVIDHGDPMTQSNAHGWCVTYTRSEVGGSSVTVQMPMNFAPFSKRLEILREEGMRIGVVDASCYSGGAIAVLSAQACVVSEQTRNRYARGTDLVTSLERVVGRSLYAKQSLDEVYLQALSDERESAVNQPGITGFVKKDDISESLTRWLSRYDSGDGDSFWDEKYDEAFPSTGDDLDRIRAYLLRPRAKLSADDETTLNNLFTVESELQTRTSLEGALNDLRKREVLEKTRFAEATPEQFVEELKGLLGELRELQLEIHFRVPKNLQQGVYRPLSFNYFLKDLKSELDRWVWAPGPHSNRIHNDEVIFFHSALFAYRDVVFGEPAAWQKKDTRDYLARFGIVSELQSTFAYQQVADRLPLPGEARDQLVAALKTARDEAVSKLDPSVKKKIDRYLELSEKLRGHVRSSDAIRFNRMQKVSLRLRAIDFLNWKRQLMLPKNAGSEDARQFQQCLDFKLGSRPKPAVTEDPVKAEDEDPIGG